MFCRDRLRTSHRHFFASPALFAEATKLVSSYGFRLPARRFVFFELFNQVTFGTEVRFYPCSHSPYTSNGSADAFGFGMCCLLSAVSRDGEFSTSPSCKPTITRWPEPKISWQAKRGFA